MYNTVNSEYFNNAPACPSSHPVRVPQVTFEITWDTQKFANLWDPAKDGNPFTWSFEGTSSGTGAGTHADYMFGWKGDSLQRAMDKSECFYDGCGSIKKQQMSEANKCTVKDFVKEEIDGCRFQFFFSPTSLLFSLSLSVANVNLIQQGKNSCLAWRLVLRRRGPSLLDVAQLPTQRIFDEASGDRGYMSVNDLLGVKILTG